MNKFKSTLFFVTLKNISKHILWKIRDNTRGHFFGGGFFFLILIKNCYGIGNNVWKFQVSMMKIVPVSRIWS